MREADLLQGMIVSHGMSNLIQKVDSYRLPGYCLPSDANTNVNYFCGFTTKGLGVKTVQTAVTMSRTALSFFIV